MDMDESGTPNYFNPRPPRGGRLIKCRLHDMKPEFQSTPPARGATLPQQPDSQNTGISIHAPREGGDRDGSRYGLPNAISIHAPREGGDQLRPAEQRDRKHFNPRPPRGGRQAVPVIQPEPI